MTAILREPFGHEPLAESYQPETPFLGTAFVSESWQQREHPADAASFGEQSWAPQSRDAVPDRVSGRSAD